MSVVGGTGVKPSQFTATRTKTDVLVGVRPSGWFDQDGANAAKRLIDWGVRAEELGFDALFVGDRLLSEGRSSEGVVYGAAMLDPFVVLTAIAARTQRIGLATLVAVIPFRHPASLAKTTASLDLLSGGRLILGAGAGWSDPELRLFGVDRRTRGPQMEEGIDLIRRLWSGEAVSYEGRFWTLQDVRVLPRPMQRPGPAVWLGSFSPDDHRLWVDGDIADHAAPLGRVGRVADAWVPLTYSAAYMAQLTPSMLADAWLYVRNSAVAAGRRPEDVQIIYAHWIAVVRNTTERRACEDALRRYFRGSYEDAIQTYLIGSPDEIVDSVRRRTAQLERVDGYLFTPIDDSPEQLEAVATEIRPRLAKTAPLRLPSSSTAQS